MKTILCIVLPAALLALANGHPARAADGAELRQAFDSMYHARLDVATTLQVDSLTILRPDFVLRLDTGRIAFLAPVVIDSVSHRWAAYFEGAGRIQFTPPVQTEQDQLARFFKSDSLNRPFSQVLLVFGDSLAAAIGKQCAPADKTFGKRARSDAKQRLRNLTRDENFYYVFTELASLVDTPSKPFFLADLSLEGKDRVFYLFNPCSREEVQFLKHYWVPGQHHQMELVCSYHQGLDSTYRTINGVSKVLVRPIHYTTDGAINKSGKYTGSAVMTAAVLRSPVQLLQLSLHEKLKVDSVLDTSGKPVQFLRYKNKDHKSLPLYLILDRPFTDRDTLKLTFYYQGDIAKAELGIFNVTAGGQWYPHVAYQQHATFDMTFRTPARYEFVATGTQVARKTIGDTLVTRWQVAKPARNVSFGIGPVDRFSYTDSTGRPIDIYYSEQVHESAMWEQFGLRTRTRNIQDQVARDVIDALALYSRRFGRYEYPRLTVTEIFSPHGEAFPGFIQLGMPTWIATDRWGEQQLFRAHEVAHQWWGVGVSTETYHDQWLSEGFAEYSALLYIQSVLGDHRFYYMIDEDKDEIFSVRKYIFGLSGAEAGPIILGFRTQSSKTEGDYQLVIYKKGALVLHMIRWLLTDLKTLDDSRFYKMMADYYRTYLDSTATTADFQHVVERYTHEDMTWFFREWVFETNLPTFKFTYEVAKGDGGTYIVLGTVKTEGVSAGFRMPVPVEIEYDNKTREYRRVLIDRPEMSFSITGLSRRPKKIRFNPFDAVLARVKQ